MEQRDEPSVADPFATDETASAVAVAAADAEFAAPTQRGGGIWWLGLLLVIVFGYLSAARRESLGRFIEQIVDIVRDFRGYDPDF